MEKLKVGIYDEPQIHINMSKDDSTNLIVSVDFITKYFETVA